MSGRRSRLIHVALIVTLLAAAGAEALCALPCAMPAEGPAAAEGVHDHCASAAAATDPGTAVSSAATACSDHDGLAPAVESGSRRSVDGPVDQLPPIAWNMPAAERRTTSLTATSPPGSHAIPAHVPLRI